MWKNKKLDAVARASLYQPVNKGGLGLLNIELQALALRTKQISAILCPEKTKSCASLTKYWLRQKLFSALPTVHRQFLGDHTYPMCNYRKIPEYQLEIIQVLRTENVQQLFIDRLKVPTFKQIYKCLFT